MAGLYYEQFEIDMEFRHALTRTVTEMDNTMFCALTHNPQPLHLDEEFARQTEFGRRIVTRVKEKRESKSRPKGRCIIFFV
jgi:acyl dehydratase